MWIRGVDKRYELLLITCNHCYCATTPHACCCHRQAMKKKQQKAQLSAADLLKEVSVTIVSSE